MHTLAIEPSNIALLKEVCEETGYAKIVDIKANEQFAVVTLEAFGIELFILGREYQKRLDRR